MYGTTMNKPPIYEPETLSPTATNKGFVERVKSNPLLGFALVGLTGIVGYRFNKIRKNRAAGVKERLSLQLIHTRLAAQGFVIGTLTLTVCYLLGKRVYEKVTGVKLDSHRKPSERGY